MVEATQTAQSSLSISLVKGLARIKPTHKATVRSLGLTGIGQTVKQPDNAAIRGMVHQVRYLLKVEPAAA